MTAPVNPTVTSRSSFWRTVKMVAWSFVGIRKNSEYKNDLAQVNPFHVIAVGIIAVLLLIAGLIMALRKKWISHRNIMITALILSVLFLLSYIAHHLFSGEAIYGDLNEDRILSPDEKLAAGPIRNLYLAILITHIPLAGIALPFIMFAAYRALSGDYEKHKKLVRFVWPAWFYVAITGVIVYWMIRPYYH